MGNTCLAKSLVYKAEVSTDKDDAKVYIGVTANSFQERFRNHTKPIKNERHGKETELSKYIWKRQTRALMQSWFPKMQPLSRRKAFDHEKKQSEQTQNNSGKTAFC